MIFCIMSCCADYADNENKEKLGPEEWQHGSPLATSLAKSFAIKVKDKLGFIGVINCPTLLLA